MISWVTVSFSNRTLLRGISKEEIPSLFLSAGDITEAHPVKLTLTDDFFIQSSSLLSYWAEGNLKKKMYESWNFNFGNTPLDWIQELLE